jgi:hypothetical protein
VWENNHAEEGKDRSGWNHTRNPDNAQGAAEAAQTHEKRLDMRRRKYPELRGKVVDYISHSIDDGILCMNICFKDKTLFSFRFACDMFIVGADLSDWKTGNYDIIREYMMPIPR